MQCSLGADPCFLPIGDDVNPSLALLERHVLALDADLDDQYRFAATASQRREAALGGFVPM